MNLRHLLVDTYVHMPPPLILSDLTDEQAIGKSGAAPHSIAEIVAHMSFWQDWFLKRCRGEAEPMAAQAALGWPAVETGNWLSLRNRFLSGLEEASTLSRGDLAVVLTPSIDFPPLAHYTVGDALTHLAVHNSHHLGQVVLLRQMLGIWPPPSGSWTW